MSLNMHEQWKCQTCSRCFQNEAELWKHIAAFRSRVQHLITALQHALAHSSPTTTDDEEDYDSHDDGDDDIRQGDSEPDRQLLCPHPDCKGKPMYTQRKNLNRHYTTHVLCDEACPFCNHRSFRVRQYVRHLDNCKPRKTVRGGSSGLKEAAAMTKKRILYRTAASELDRSMSAAVNRYRAVEAQSTASKRMLDTVGVEQRPQKRRLAMADGADSPTQRAPKPVQALGGDMTEATELCYSLNDSRPSNIMSGQFAVGSDGFSTHYTEAPPRAPLLFSEPMDWQTYASGQGGATIGVEPSVMSSHSMSHLGDIVTVETNMGSRDLSSALVRNEELVSYGTIFVGTVGQA